MAEIISDVSASSTSRINNAEWWLKDPYYPDDYLQFNPIDTNGGHPFRRKQASATFNPINRPYPVVVLDALQGVRAELTFFFSNAAGSYSALKYLYGLQRPLLLQSGWISEQMYIIFDGDWKEKILNASPETREVTLSYIEVERPEGALTGFTGSMS